MSKDKLKQMAELKNMHCFLEERFANERAINAEDLLNIIGRIINLLEVFDD